MHQISYMLAHSIQSKAILLLVMSAVFITACKDKQSAEQVVVQETDNKTNEIQNSTELSEMTILCFGNSLTAGYGLEESEAWPALLQERIDSLELEYTVINAGLSGETSSGGLNRIEWVLRQKADIFILELGANDMLRGLDVESTRSNLSQIISVVKEHNPDCKIIVAGMMSPPNMGKSYEDAFNAIYPELAKASNASLIPFFLKGVATIEDLNLPDGKHPNAEGQKVVLENVWQHLKPLLN